MSQQPTAAAEEQAAKQPTKATPARQWKTGGLYQLPSGNIAHLKRPSLLARATMPGKLEQKVLRFIVLETPRMISEEDHIRLYVANSEAYLAVAAATLVSPRLILDRQPDPDKDEIGPDDLSDRDYTWIYQIFVEGSDAESRDFFRAVV
jgi:hypothetical protein